MTPKQIQKFWSMVDSSNGENSCWPWTRAVNRWRGGYGIATITGDAGVSVMWLTHRLAYTLAFGPIPKGIHCLHRCDNPPCCNPNHLWLGTNKDNVEDKMKKGRQPRGDEMGCSKLTANEVLRIRKLREDGFQYAEIAKHFNVTSVQIGVIVRRENWLHI